jgi:hypothetical protein
MSQLVMHLSLILEKQMTLELKRGVNTASGSRAMQISSKYEGDFTSATGWGGQISGTSLAFYMAGASFFDLMVSVPTGPPNVKDGLWHHVAVVYDRSEQCYRMYFLY